MAQVGVVTISRQGYRALKGSCAERCAKTGWSVEANAGVTPNGKLAGALSCSTGSVGARGNVVKRGGVGRGEITRTHPEVVLEGIQASD